ncbi:FixH [Rubripirellula lacrimiformis]|uniref:FixH n=1 Tax=Rubripirellula lacrimiformis TaxID=1930273 RepID=A0A517N9M6_9BACT|nr:FixH family protein [Rubripirellula lacrimiformis]QDT03836.1 FixH [Rubripirellula lacrimiformis]
MNSVSPNDERRAKRFWVSLVVGLLGLQLTIGGVAIYLATGDPTAAVIPNYHETALDWDTARRAGTAADRMGWEIQVSASDVVDDRGMRATDVLVQDQNGNPVDALAMTARVYHHARASDVVSFSLPSVGDGHYIALAPLSRPGLWQFEVSIDGADQLIRQSMEIDLDNQQPPTGDISDSSQKGT